MKYIRSKYLETARRGLLQQGGLVGLKDFIEDANPKTDSQWRIYISVLDVKKSHSFGSV